jgi:pimeloyl-ACP methyl ester carboxylesterase
MWLPVAEELARKYRVTLLDLRGHGRSEVGLSAIRMTDHAADVERVCRDIGLQQAVFAGVSLGGYVLFEFWRRYRPRVRALVLASTRAANDTTQVRASRLQSATDVLERGTSQFIDTMVPKLLGETTRRNRLDIVEAARHTMRLSTPAGIAAIQHGMAERPDSTATLATIDVPTLLICGDEDTISPPCEMNGMQQRIAASQLVAIPAAGHFAVFEKSAESAKIIRNFLDAL